ncbi:MAG: hypothetical protein O2907_06185 [Proteobacteria bacterium]|nr:hypothetical protein [Pseudomonadota bacterium]MDA1063905.1 hypothetical protein [Pseudomonadota bacterium]
MNLSRLIKEPLLHFFIVAALLFALYSVLNPDAMRSEQEILVDQARVTSLSTQFERIWQRPPTESELQSLIDGWCGRKFCTAKAWRWDWSARTRLFVVALHKR